MKHMTRFGVTAVLAAVLVLGACPSGDVSYTPDDPGNKRMSRATAEGIFGIENGFGGLEITSFKSASRLLAWLLATGEAQARLAVNVEINEFAIPAYIDNTPVVKIGAGAFASSGGPGADTDISTVVERVKLPGTVSSLGADLFGNQIEAVVTLVVPPAVRDKVGAAAVAATVGPKSQANVSGEATMYTPTLPVDAESFPATAGTEWTLVSYTDGQASLSDGVTSAWYKVEDEGQKALFAAIYEPNKPGSSDRIESGKTVIPYDAEVSADVLKLFKITFTDDEEEPVKVELKGTGLPHAAGASARNLIVVDIGKPSVDNSGLPKFKIPYGGLGDANLTSGDYSHVRLRVNNGAELVILSDNSGYIFEGVGNPNEPGNFKGGAVEVMSEGKLRDGAYEGFPLGAGAVIVSRPGSYLSIGPEEDDPDATGDKSAIYNAYFKGYLIGPSTEVEGEAPRVTWDADNNEYNYLEVRAEGIATDAKLTVKKNMGLIYSVWFVGNGKLTVDLTSPSNGDGLWTNEFNGNGEDYNFYSTTATSGLITVKSGLLDKRFFIDGAKGMDQADLISKSGDDDVVINGTTAGERVEYEQTGIYGYLVTLPAEATS
jgi:hypothetical protein